MSEENIPDSKSPAGLARAGIWALVDNVMAAALSFAFFVIIAQVLSPVEFGIGAIALSLVQILQPLVESLFHDVIVQKPVLRDSDVKAATLSTILFGCLIAGALLLCAPLIARVFDTDALRDYMLW